MTKLEGRLLVSILVLLGTVLASSCDPVDPGAAAVQNSAGEIIIAAKTCKDSKVTSVRLIGTGASSDTLWEIDAPDGSSIESYVLGVTAPGFEQRTPLQEQPAPGRRYV